MIVRPRIRRPKHATLVATVVLLTGVLLSVALPTWSWVRQRGDLADAQTRLSAMRSENDLLEERVAGLGSDDYIESEARGKYFYAAPGDESYTVTGQPAPLVGLPDVWPFDKVAEPLQKAIERRFSQLTPIPSRDNPGP